MIVAVTGASGFVGTELISTLKDKDNIDILALTRDATHIDETNCCKWRSTDYSANSLTALFGELSGYDRAVDVVIHLAGVRGTDDNPGKFKVNEAITESVLKAMVTAGIKRIVFASTISVYDDESFIPWGEGTPLHGRTAYGESKIRCEQIIEEYGDRYGLTYAIARIAQVIGEDEKRRGMMNTFIDAARKQEILQVVGRSVAKRQFIHIDDVAEILTLLACGNQFYDNRENTIINVGMRKAYTNYEIAQIVNETFSNPSPIEYLQNQPETIKSACMDVSRLINTLGYTPLNMEESLRKFL